MDEQQTIRFVTSPLNGLFPPAIPALSRRRAGRAYNRSNSFAVPYRVRNWGLTESLSRESSKPVDLDRLEDMPDGISINT